MSEQQTEMSINATAVSLHPSLPPMMPIPPKFEFKPRIDQPEYDFVKRKTPTNKLLASGTSDPKLMAGPVQFKGNKRVCFSGFAQPAPIVKKTEKSQQQQNMILSSKYPENFISGTNPYLSNSINIDEEREKLYRRQAARYADLTSIKNTQKLLTSLEQIHNRELRYEKEQKRTMEDLEKKRRESVLPFVEVTARANIELLNSVSHQETPFGFSFSKPLIEYWQKNPHMAIHTLSALCLMCRQHDIFKFATIKSKMPMPAISQEERDKCVLIGMRTYPFPVVYGQWTDQKSVKECNTVSGLIKNAGEVTILSHSNFERKSLQIKLQQEDKQLATARASSNDKRALDATRENANVSSIQPSVQKTPSPVEGHSMQPSVQKTPHPAEDDMDAESILVIDEKETDVQKKADLKVPGKKKGGEQSVHEGQVDLPVRHVMSLRSSSKKPDYLGNVESRSQLHRSALLIKRLLAYEQRNIENKKKKQ